MPCLPSFCQPVTASEATRPKQGLRCTRWSSRCLLPCADLTSCHVSSTAVPAGTGRKLDSRSAVQLRGGGVTFTDADRDVPAEVPSTDTHAAAGLETSASAEPVIDLDWGSLILETEEGAQGETSDGGEEDAAGAPHIQTVADGDESSGSGDGVKVASDGPAIISWDCEQTPEAGTPLDTGAATPPVRADAAAAGPCTASCSYVCSTAGGPFDLVFDLAQQVPARAGRPWQPRHRTALRLAP